MPLALASEILDSARQTIDLEANAISRLKNQLNDHFGEVVQLLLQSSGRLVVTGIGKSAIIAQKIVATLNSTGTPSIFMHAADAIHGDLGIITPDDVVMCLSKSGNTPEIKALVPLLRQGGNPLIALVGNTESFLAKHADYVLDATVEREACPNNLAPTTSTTAQLVLGDALAVCLLDQRKFDSRDFARFHPGGALGKQLYLKLEDIARQNEKPAVGPQDALKEVVLEMTRRRLGMTAVVTHDKVIGIITDGDIRRMLEKSTDIGGLMASDIMSEHPFCMEADTLAVDAAAVMRQKKISQIIVLKDNRYFGVVHLHDLNREGIL